MIENESPISTLSTEKCKSCGADLKYKPGTHEQVCEYCGNTEKITIQDHKIVESDYLDFLKNSVGSPLLQTKKFFHCTSCGATSSVENNIQSTHCPYCGNPLVESNIKEEKIIRPEYIVPFVIDHKQVKTLLSRWIKNLWFVPDNLKKEVLSSTFLQGVYIPYWTYDADTYTRYTGSRGDNYTTTSRDSKGNTRTVTHTRWSFSSGSVSYFFDDILIPASDTIPRNILKKLEPWHEKEIIPFDEKYITGFVTEKYTLNLEEGFTFAQSIMEKSIQQKIRRDIGGDSQRINSMNPQFKNISFKHILLPIYLSSYRYKDKIYHFYVNGKNGKIKGERPYDTLKIAIVAVWSFVFILFIIILFSLL